MLVTHFLGFGGSSTQVIGRHFCLHSCVPGPVQLLDRVEFLPALLRHVQLLLVLTPLHVRRLPVHLHLLEVGELDTRGGGSPLQVILFFFGLELRNFLPHLVHLGLQVINLLRFISLVLSDLSLNDLARLLDEVPLSLKVLLVPDRQLALHLTDLLVFIERLAHTSLHGVGLVLEHLQLQLGRRSDLEFFEHLNLLILAALEVH